MRGALHVPLATFQSPPIVHHTLELELARVFEQQLAYLQEGMSKWKYPQILNLNNYITEISCDFHCFLIDDNFQNVHISQSTNPIILRTPVPFVHRDVRTWAITYHISLGLHLRNMSLQKIGFPLDATFLSSRLLT